MEFIESPIFTQLLSDYMEDDQFQRLQVFLALDPKAGDVMPGTGGCRKVRWADRRRGKGKRGGLRSLFQELMSGVEAMREHCEGRLTLRTHEVAPIALPPVNPQLVRETREALQMSRQVFAFKLGVNPRTLERWEQGRSKPNEQAAALIWLVRKFPDTLERLESLSVPV
ncbi:MAG: helix-turn-helix domain-containing protein [bacterium]